MHTHYCGRLAGPDPAYTANGKRGERAAFSLQPTVSLLPRVPDGKRLFTFFTSRSASSLHPASIAAMATCSCNSHTAGPRGQHEWQELRMGAASPPTEARRTLLPGGRSGAAAAHAAATHTAALTLLRVQLAAVLVQQLCAILHHPLRVPQPQQAHLQGTER